MKLTAKITTAVAIAAAFLLGAATQTTEAAPVKVESVASWSSATTLKLPTRPCTEDNTIVRSCYWDAAKLGNGKGYSYVIDARGNVIYLNPKLNDQAARLKFNAAQRKAGKEHWGTVDGHQFCWAKVGDTSYIECFDGYKTTS
jgi:Skp family chaperone for outer membrane proteins